MVQAEHSLVFLHIPKTGGTTLESVLLDQYGQEHSLRLDLAAVNDAEGARRARALLEDGRRYKLISGHFTMGLGVHELLNVPCTYVTMLRDPIERVISDFYFILHTPEHIFHERIVRERMSLEDYLNSDLSDGTDNYQVRCLCSRPPDAQDGNWDCTEQTLTSAKDNLKKYFKVVGFLEHFDESLLLMRLHFGWKLPLYVRENTTKNRPRTPQVTEQIKSKIRNRNRYDLELYDHALLLYKQQLRTLRSGRFERQLNQYKFLNRWYGRTIDKNYHHRSRASRLRAFLLSRAWVALLGVERLVYRL
ncbi:sulfotransferase family 2 domain-containing protein [Gloeobacter morelensis]|uniref:Sulfotransferase family 2 domain-containing protein n=1 Tax=Gloeobacter morelensis MG652769 TaxID=2781736 RepID=A0ABY3PHI5_9CYAN|nr:sulfotransferase family 2 domain-containing protein [Gloeobacter morelensis]UFP93094.1 sulfotransferase family 2 domain-containing protein [Gloeobacter morelensis MG652769]